MPIIGFAIKSVNAYVNEERMDATNINVNSTPTIVDIDRKEFSLKGIGSVLAVSFKFEVKYEPDVGRIELAGEIAFQDDEADEILNRWKDSKQIKDSVAVEVLNAILRRCVSRAIGISEELRLPPPISFPVVKSGKKKETK